MVELLLKYGADVNATNKRGDTPLDWALYVDNIRVARILLVNEADVNISKLKQTKDHNASYHLLRVVHGMCVPYVRTIVCVRQREGGLSVFAEE